jgi:ribosomal protein S18 acetylase RimI-like enzyme
MALFQRVIPILRASGNDQWDDSYPSPSTFEHDLEAGQLWIAEASGQLLGVAAITTEQPPEYADAGLNINENAIVVHRLAVDPAFRGVGIASTLMLHAEDVARNGGIAVLRVDTNKLNEAAKRLFDRHQYRLAGEIELSFRPGMQVLCYEKRLDHRAPAGR